MGADYSLASQTQASALSGFNQISGRSEIIAPNSSASSSFSALIHWTHSMGSLHSTLLGRAYAYFDIVRARDKTIAEAAPAGWLALPVAPISSAGEPKIGNAQSGVGRVGWLLHLSASRVAAHSSCAAQSRAHNCVALRHLPLN